MEPRQLVQTQPRRAAAGTTRTAGKSRVQAQAQAAEATLVVGTTMRREWKASVTNKGEGDECPSLNEREERSLSTWGPSTASRERIVYETRGNPPHQSQVHWQLCCFCVGLPARSAITRRQPGASGSPASPRTSDGPLAHWHYWQTLAAEARPACPLMRLMRQEPSPQA